MKLCFSTLACPGWNLRQMIDACVVSRIDGIDFRGIGEEIDVTRSPLFTDELETTLELLRAAGVTMPCLNTSVTLLSPTAERWQMMLEETQRYAQLAQQTQTRWVRIFGGAAPKQMPHDRARMLAQRHLRQVIKICATHECIPLLETHDDWTTSNQVLELLHEFDPGDVGVIWDAEHPFRHGEAPLETAQSLRRYLRHVQVKDSVYRGDEYCPQLLGQGQVPLPECFQALRQIGYEGWICLETEKRWYAGAPEPEQSIPQFSDYIRGLWSDATAQT